MNSIELRQLRYFVAVAEERHFGRAADRLRIAQPGLSQQIKLLERLVGVPLFIRGTRGVELTEAGEAFLQHARLALELADRAVESARLAPEGQRGVLKFGTLSREIPVPMRDLLRAFEERNPHVKLEVTPGYIQHHVEALMRHALDVAFVYSPFDRPTPMRYERMGSVDLLAAVPEGHRFASMPAIPVAELIGEPFLDWPRNANRALYDHLHMVLFGGNEHPRKVEVLDINEHSYLLLVAAGEGITVADFTHLADLPIPGVVFRPFIEAPTIEYGLAWMDASASPWASAFVDLARELAQD